MRYILNFTILTLFSQLSCNNSIEKQFKIKEPMLIELDSIILANYDTIFSTYATGYHGLAVIGLYKLETDSLLHHNPIIYNIKNLMIKLQCSNIKITENKEVIFLDKKHESFFYSTLFFWVYSKSGVIHKDTKILLSIDKIYELSNKNYSYVKCVNTF